MPIQVFCPSCNTTLRAPDDSVGKRVKCPKCGQVLVVGGEEREPEHAFREPPRPERPVRRPPPPRDYPPEDDEDAPRRRPYRRYRRPEGPGPGFGVAALVLGIVSLLTSCLCSFFGIPVAVLAIIFGCLGLRGEGRGMAIAGLILGGVALVLVVVLLIVGVGMHVLQRF